jgi:putative acetyltransferase
MIAIREFRPGDEPALRAVFESAIHGTARRDYSQLQVDTWAPRPHDPGAWALRIQGLQPFVAGMGDAIVGYADVQASGYIDHFYVAAEAGGQGVGGALMRRILARAQALGLAELTSHVSLTAQPFFAHFGFEIVEHRRVNVRGVEMRNAAMRRRLVQSGALRGT